MFSTAPGIHITHVTSKLNSFPLLQGFDQERIKALGKPSLKILYLMSRDLLFDSLLPLLRGPKAQDSLSHPSLNCGHFRTDQPSRVHRLLPELGPETARANRTPPGAPKLPEKIRQSCRKLPRHLHLWKSNSKRWFQKMQKMERSN